MNNRWRNAGKSKFTDHLPTSGRVPRPPYDYGRSVPKYPPLKIASPLFPQATGSDRLAWRMLEKKPEKMAGEREDHSNLLCGHGLLDGGWWWKQGALWVTVTYTSVHEYVDDVKVRLTREKRSQTKGNQSLTHNHPVRFIVPHFTTWVERWRIEKHQTERSVLCRGLWV